ncbi:phytoene/squalene synthase family protein [Nocardia puris]|uniref:phytoene/squalene synthase family protein n=1 Tax=Nocardia puris TaxID=208602 RepID=UPI0018931340|nr:phytoene/squalene synthase family protein [Nocardia puris]MBF6212968.1 phytoene/squalene synthase family protein [Nocardia puris]MBF6367959.1 phytoene/squalene synthase family protein [Nocardia puris]MBF6462592.1 phytoene/squalene synthase family protein [Nocardia puris]
MSTGADLAPAYRTCRAIAAAHGRTYFLATRLLTAERRPAVHALYAFARVVDDIVDGPSGGSPGLVPEVSDPSDDMGGTDGPPHDHRPPSGPRTPTANGAPGRPERSASDVTRWAAQPPTPADELDHLEVRLRAVLDGNPGAVDGLPAHRAHVLAATGDTIRRYDIDHAHFWTFLDSMRMDVPGTPLFRDRYADMGELREYMRGSAAAIGLQVLPILGTVTPRAEAEPAAAALGEAFQLTNFLRDVAEDLDRGRIYLPADELAAFGVDADLLARCRRTGRTDPRVRRALAHLIAVNRDLYRLADPGIDLLTPRVRPAIRAASTLYAAILTRIEESGYAVFQARAVVPRRHRLAVAGSHLVTSLIRRD